jgi:hypothetical protein
VCPETAQVIADLSNINKKVAEQPTLEPQAAEIKTASLAGPAAYLGAPAAAAMIVNKLGENFEQQVAPETNRAGISTTLTRPLPCSLALASCRRYASLREQLAHKATLKLEEPEREKARSSKKKTAKKKKSSKRRYSDAGEPREYREVRSEPRHASDDRQWLRSSRYE